MRLTHRLGVYTVYQLTTCDGREYVGVTGMTVAERTTLNGHQYAPVSNVRVLGRVTDPEEAAFLEAAWIEAVKTELGDQCANVTSDRGDYMHQWWTPERRASRAERQKVLLADPKYRQRQVSALAQATRSPKRRAEVSEQMRRDNPMWKPENVAKVKASWTPERRAAAAERMRNRAAMNAHEE